MGAHAPERLSALRRVATIESIGSSTRIEGSKLSDKAVEQLLSNLEIHPFQDGNGRLSRILTTLLLLRNGYTYVAYSSLESVIEQTKENYYFALRKTQATIRRDAPDWQAWILYFLRTLQKQKLRLEKKIAQERIIIDQLPELSVQILELAKEHGRITTGQVTSMTGANRNTIKKHLQALVSANQLTSHGQGKGTWYSSN